jgi:hypothetical protein
MPTSDLNAAEAVPRSSGIQLLPAGSDRPGRDAGIRNTIRLLVANELPLVMSSRPRKRAQGHVRYGLSRIKAPERELGDCDAAHRSDKSQAKRCRLSGVAGGVAFIPAVPGLAPRAFMGQGEDRDPVRHGVCRIKAPSASWGTVTRRTDQTRARRSGVVYLEWQAGWPSVPQSPGSRPGLVWVRGRMPVANDRRDGTGNPDPWNVAWREVRGLPAPLEALLTVGRPARPRGQVRRNSAPRLAPSETSCRGRTRRRWRREGARGSLLARSAV